MNIEEAWDRWLNVQPMMKTDELVVAKRAFYAAFAAGAGEGATIDAVVKLPGIPSRASLVVKMLRLYQALIKEEPGTVVLLYGPSLAAVLEERAPKVKELIASIAEEAKDRG